MDFALDEEHILLERTIRDFASKEIEPHAAEWVESEEFPYETIKKMVDLGLFGIHFDAKHGGSGDELMFVIAIEEISRASAGLGVIYLVSLGLAMYPIILWGNEEQKRSFIPQVIKGNIAAFALTEPTVGSDVGALQTTYREKDGCYILNGNKIFITNGAEADFVTTFAAKDRSLGHRGISAFIVERDAPGYSVGKVERKMGLHPASAAEIIFDECKIPKENLIGEEGQGFRIAMEAIDASRVSIAAQAVGIAQAAYDAVVEYSRERGSS